MSPEEQVSRYEINRNVRMIFTRHDVDLSMIDYSFTGSTVYLYGDLVRADGDYSVKDIESIVREISALPHVRDIQFALNNWVVLSAEGSWQINKIKKSAVTRAASQPGALGDSTVVIDKSEKITDVLDDLELNLEKDDDDEKNQPK
jgi:hypothetical protein